MADVAYHDVPALEAGSHEGPPPHECASLEARGSQNQVCCLRDSNRCDGIALAVGSSVVCFYVVFLGEGKCFVRFSICLPLVAW